MRRALSRLADETFDLLIVGGGITGACIARDAALRGLKVALVEKGDFAGAASANNSKLIHGGLRYLRNLELGLVRESLRERRIWLHVAPHLVRPLPFLLPLFEAGWRVRATLEAGLSLYDVLSFDRGRLDDPDQRLLGHSWLGKQDAAAREPILASPGLAGAYVYYDAQMYSPERLALECLIDADAHGAAIANYVEAESVMRRDRQVTGCAVRDCLSRAEFDIRAQLTVAAAGPWADIFLQRALGRPTSHKLVRSKGIHLIVPARTHRFALTVAAEGGHFFLLPWRGHTLLGTTDTAFAGDPDEVGVGEREIMDFLSFINRHLPAADIGRAQVEHFYAGLRPLIDDGTTNTYDASRQALIVDHGKGEGVDGLLSVIGGKWTTSRALAGQVVDIAVNRLGARADKCMTAVAPLPGGATGRFAEFESAQKAAHPQIKDIAHLAHLYGTQLPDVLGPAQDRPELLRALGTTGDIAAQVVHAVHSEMAVALADVVLRRTGIGQLGTPGPAILDDISRLMALELNWDETRRLTELKSLSGAFQLQEGG